MRQLATIRAKLTHGYEVNNRITISRSALLNNFDILQSLQNSHIIPVLKSNAYGHGITQVCQILSARKPVYLAVDGYYEALTIRKHSNKQPVLIMGSIGTNDINHLNKKGFAFTAFSMESVEALCRAKKPIVVHLEVDTGMHRHGLSLDELSGALSLFQQNRNVVIEGVMTHLADADNPDTTYSKMQHRMFTKAVRQVRAAGYTPLYIHSANSPGSTKAMPASCNTVRPGIALFGANVLKPQDPAYRQLSQLKPVLELSTKIDQIITVAQGERIGYNGTYICKRQSRIATTPIGYYDGVPQQLNNTPFATISGKTVPTAGKVCMNHTMFDCTDIQANVGTEVTLISRQTNAPNTLANLCTISHIPMYSILSGLRSTTRREIVD